MVTVHFFARCGLKAVRMVDHIIVVLEARIGHFAQMPVVSIYVGQIEVL